MHLGKQPHAGSRWSPWLRALAWPSPHCGGHLEAHKPVQEHGGWGGAVAAPDLGLSTCEASKSPCPVLQHQAPLTQHEGQAQPCGTCVVTPLTPHTKTAPPRGIQIATEKRNVSLLCSKQLYIQAQLLPDSWSCAPACIHVAMHVTRHPTHGGPTHTPQHKQPILSSPAHQPAIIFGHKISLSSFLFQLPMDFLKDSAIESPKYPRLDKARVQDRDLAGARHVSPAAPSDDRHVPHDGSSHGQPGREPVWRAQQADCSCQPSPCSVTIKELH